MRPEFMIDYRSKTGIEHQKRNLENQDACFSEIQEGENACLCIADGAGSKKHAALGAQQLVQKLCTTLMQNASELFQKAEQEISDFLSEEIHRLLREVAKAKNVEFRELSSTLLFTLTNGETYITGHLGDGVILGEQGSKWSVLSLPQNGQTARTTYLTTMPLLKNHLRITKKDCKELNRIWMMTDGAMYATFQPYFQLPKGRSLEKSILQAAHKMTEDDATYGYLAWKGEESYAIPI